VLLPTLLYACSQFFGCYISTKQAKAVAKEAAEQAQVPLPDPPTLQNMAEREFQKHQASQKAEFHASMAQGALCGGGCLALYGLLLGFYLAPPEVRVCVYVGAYESCSIWFMSSTAFRSLLIGHIA